MPQAPEFRSRIPSSDDTLSVLQKRFETRIDYSKITSGTEIPHELLRAYYQHLPAGSLIANMGSGNGVKANTQAEIARDYGHKLVAIDFNEKGTSYGVADARERGVENVEHITLDLVGEEMRERIGKGKQISMSIMEALLCNLMGVDAEIVVAHMANSLMNGGYALVADCVTVDDPESRLLLESMGQFDQAYIEEWAKNWRMRYANNARALQTSSNDYTFVVMPPGIDKQKYEYADSETLLRLVANKEIERLARHWEKPRLLEIFKRSSMELVEWIPKVWISRAGEPLLGQVAVFQKRKIVDDRLSTTVSSLALPVMYATMSKI